MPDAVTVNGRPLRKLRMLFTCQPPSIADHTLRSLNHRRPRPKGSSAMPLMFSTCVRSMSLMAVFKW